MRVKNKAKVKTEVFSLMFQTSLFIQIREIPSQELSFTMNFEIIFCKCKIHIAGNQFVNDAAFD